MTIYQVTRLGPHRYQVGTHAVDLRAEGAADACTCGDYVYRRQAKGLSCKHMRAATLLDRSTLPIDHLEVRIP